MAFTRGSGTDAALPLEAQGEEAGLAGLGCGSSVTRPQLGPPPPSSPAAVSDTVPQPSVSAQLDIAALTTVYPSFCIPVQTRALTPGFWRGRRRL